MQLLGNLFTAIQTVLIPQLEESFSETLTEREQRFIRTVEICAVEKHMIHYSNNSITGRPPKERLSIALAFIAKSIYNFATTKLLIDYLRANRTLRQLCGWEGRYQVPSESTFCRAFAEFAIGQLPSAIHKAMIEAQYGDKLVGHIARDSTPIDAREKPVRKESSPTSRGTTRRGRPKKGEIRPPKEPSKLQVQLTRTLQENLDDLATHCAVGTKADSKGYKKTWIGYKLHADVVDGDIPVSVIITSAATHDSQVAIPLAQMSRQRVTNLYDLMDAAYDAQEIKEISKRFNHVAIIDSNPRRNGEKIPFAPAQKIRYNQRTSAERLMSNIKDNLGGRNVRVRGMAKVTAHLMFAVIALTAEQLFRLIN